MTQQMSQWERFQRMQMRIAEATEKKRAIAERFNTACIELGIEDPNDNCIDLGHATASRFAAECVLVGTEVYEVVVRDRLAPEHEQIARYCLDGGVMSAGSAEAARLLTELRARLTA